MKKDYSAVIHNRINIINWSILNYSFSQIHLWIKVKVQQNPELCF